MRSIKIYFIILIAILSGCANNKMKETAIGKVAEIAVCASIPVYSMIENEILDALYYEITLPVRESIFYTVYVDLEKLHIYKREKNLLFITNTNRKDEYSDIINAFLTDEDRDYIKKNKAAFFTVYDGFAKGQNIFIIAGESEDDIKNIIKTRKDEILKYFIDNSYRSLEKMVYFTGVNKRLSGEFYKKMGVHLDIPSDFETSFFSKELKAYSVIAHYPDRIVTVKIEGNLQNFNAGYMIKLRNEIGKKFWDGDYIDTQFVKVSSEETEFLGYKAIYMTGTYANDVKQYGGPFICYLINTGKELIYLDGHVYLPGERKYFKLMETKTVMSTLRADQK